MADSRTDTEPRCCRLEYVAGAGAMAALQQKVRRRFVASAQVGFSPMGLAQFALSEKRDGWKRVTAEKSIFRSMATQSKAVDQANTRVDLMSSITYEISLIA